MANNKPKQAGQKNQVKTDSTTIAELLGRGVIDVIPKDSVERQVRSGAPLTIKFGIDPSGPDIHLGHAVVLRKLRQFQQAGHHVVIIIGDWTARIGDPTDKNEMRPQLTPAQVRKNATKYLKQLFLILDRKKTRVAWQSTWFNKFTLQDVFELFSKFTVSQLLNRDDFRERQKAATEIGYHEPMYSLLQGYDSVAIKADIEVGATEQLFNLLRGRDVQRIHGQSEQGIVTLEILVGLDGELKMGKSIKNYIALLDEPNNMYGKVMSIPDKLILQYFELATDIPRNELIEIEREVVSRSVNPKDLKMRLAREIVTLYHSEKLATSAEAAFVKQFQKGEVPDDIKDVKLVVWPLTVGELIIAAGLASSMNEARRLVAEGGIKIDGSTANDIKAAIPHPNKSILMSRGKRQFRRIFHVR